MNLLTPQQLKALEYNKHISLSANAGSGKTFVLSKRFVEIFINEEIELSSIVAITFTEKAAGELNRKISNEIVERIIIEKDNYKRKRLEKLQRELVLANISTIHSFCIEILREFAPEAGIDASFNPIDKINSEELIEQSVEETFQFLMKNEKTADELKSLIRLFGSRFNIKKNIVSLFQKRNIIQHLKNELYKLNEKSIYEYFSSTFDYYFDLLFTELIASGLDSLKIINDFLLKSSSPNSKLNTISDLLQDYTLQKETFAKIKILGSLKSEVITDSNGTVRNKGYLSKDRNLFETEIISVEKMFEELLPFFDSTFDQSITEKLIKMGLSFLQLYNYAENIYANKKKQRGYLDFEDILLKTHQIISLESVQNYLIHKFTYIMIDEYQDTNEIQYEIFMPILDNLNKGNLFVVGDEKQSIYMFRDADLEIFNRTKDEIINNSTSGLSLSLPHSFRMYPQLVLFVNKIFSKLFDNPKQVFNEVTYNPLVCTKSKEHIGSVGALLSEKGCDENESILVTKKILNLLKNDSSLSFGDIAILCRKRDSFLELESKFVEFKIPYTIIGGKGFYQRQSIYDIFNYLSFITNPKDDSSLIGILRSPFFNFSDSKIFTISRTEGQTFYLKLKAYQSNEKKIKETIIILENNIEFAKTNYFVDIIRKILLESGYWVLLSQKDNYEQELANVEKLLSIAREHSKKRFNTLFDFVNYLKEMISGYEDEGQANVNDNKNSVKLMTIHQSKGLEYKVVFIYDANSKGMDDSIKSKMLSIDKKFGLLAKIPSNNNYFEKYLTPPQVALYNYITKKKNIAELKRLFYVAVTRAIQHLYISGTSSDGKVSNGSFLQFLFEGMQNDFSQNEIYLADQVEFMKHENNNYEFYRDKVEMTISIEKDVPYDINVASAENKTEIKTFLNKEVVDSPKEEIISATKISIYAQCPVKYQLTYELGFQPVLQLVKSKDINYDFQPNEDDDIKQYAQLKGKIIHKILSEELEVDKLDKKISQEISVNEVGKDFETLKKTIYDDLYSYYSSVSYSQIKNYSNYENEFEVYCNVNNYFLYGIVDKLIFEGDKLIIIDYKTDNIKEKEIEKRSGNYFNQLKFYAFVLSKLYPKVISFELKLVYLKHPDKAISKTIFPNEIQEYGVEINNSINKIYNYDFKPNYKHCSQCHYFMEGKKCIKEIS